MLHRLTIQLSIRDTIIAGTCGVVFQAFVAGNVFPKVRSRRTAKKEES